MVGQHSSPSPTSPAGARQGPVVAVCEAWRVDDEWWRRPISRRYFEVVLGSGAHVVLFQDLSTHQWYLQIP